MSELSSLIPLLNVGKINISTLSRDIKEENDNSDDEKSKERNISSSEKEV